MANKILGLFLILFGISIFLPGAFKIVGKLAMVVLGGFLIYKGLQLMEAHTILFHIDRFMERMINLFK